MKLKFDDGQAQEVDGELLTVLLSGTFEIACAYIFSGAGMSDRQVIRSTNNVLKETWQNEEWLRNYMDKIFMLARKSLEERKEKSE